MIKTDKKPAVIPIIILSIVLSVAYSIVVIAFLFCFNPAHYYLFDPIYYFRSLPYIFILIFIIFLVVLLKYRLKSKTVLKLLGISFILFIISLLFGVIKFDGVSGCLAVENFLYSTQLDIVISTLLRIRGY